MSALKLLSLNIQRTRHVELVQDFLRTEKPEVATLQEVMEYDVPALSRALEAEYFFAPMTQFIAADEPHGLFGLAILSRLRFKKKDVSLYAGDLEHIPTLDQQNSATWNDKNFSLAYADVEKDGATFRIATTHLTWTPDGKPTELQRTHTRAMLDKLEPLGELVLTGDFNAPRGGEIWGDLEKRYRDNVPASVTSTLDPKFHRVKGLELVVDGIFSTSEYKVDRVEVTTGVSDHRALLAQITRT